MDMEMPLFLKYQAIVNFRKRSHTELEGGDKPEEEEEEDPDFDFDRDKKLNNQQKMADNYWKRRYRLSVKLFDDLAAKIQAHVTAEQDEERQQTETNLNFKVKFSIRVKLAIALRFAAGGIYVDIADNWAIKNNSTFYNIVWEMVDLINIVETLPGIKLDDPESLRKVSQSFSRFSQHKLVGALGAIDGFLVRIECPYRSVENPLRYYCRKGFYALNCQVICDGYRRVLWASIKHSGQTHDLEAFKDTVLYQQLVESDKIDSFALLGDSAYQSSEFMFVPYDQALPGTKEDSYNYYQSRSRICIECTFGEVFARWGFLWRAARCRLDRTVAMVNAIFLLHNLCVTEREGDDMEASSGDLALLYQSSKDFSVVMPLTTGEKEWSKTRDVTSRIRNRVRDAIAAHGLKRPPSSTFRLNERGHYMRIVPC